MLGKRHVVGQARPGQRYGDVGGQSVASVDHAIVHVGRVLGVVEEHQLAGGLVDLDVGGDAVEGDPALDAQGVQAGRIQAIALAALVEGRQRLAGMDDDVGGGGVLQRPVRPEARPQAQRRRIGQAAPQRAAGLLLGRKAAGAHEAVAIAGEAGVEVDLVDHGVAVEGVEPPQRLVDLVLGVAQIDAVEVDGDRAVDHIQVASVDLFHQRRPRAVEVGMIAGLQGADDGR